jgi:hypothetical protein
LRLHKRKLGLGSIVRQSCTKWHTDATRAQRVPLWHLEDGDVFRLLNKCGKPEGKRYVIVEQYNEPKSIEPILNGYRINYYFLPKEIIFTEVGKTERLVCRRNSNIIVKPVNGVAMMVLAKLNSYSDYNYFQA